MLNVAESRKSGFTLIELLITVAVVGVLLVLGVSSYRTWIQNTQIRTAAETLTHGLQLARAEAVRRNENVNFILGTLASWTVQTTGGTGIQQKGTNEGSPNVTVALNPTNAATITFTPLGRVLTPVIPATACSNAGVICIDVDSSILSAVDSRNLRVTVGQGGNIRMCDPTLTANSPNDPRAC